ncbi:cytochrome c oxidase assembly protein COX18, mitochondrial isoform X2 [Adelges cooleyi]|uniref:cytochrome c oxidase assembly protein COX18, mitochondrial isoform X2 n=1 Tax=Adelges cooleyi TaxID=133065 RepID=UPI0021800651|nr:cytochrome c oxidase assembly protein COX18, mitochondrial isoform X2 [Adelges cooleyi]
MLCVRLISYRCFNSYRFLSYSGNYSALNSLPTILSNSTPVAYAQNYVISLHELTGTSWWASIILSAVTLRLVITLPLTIYQHYNNAKLENLSIEFQPTVKEIQQEVTKAIKLHKWPEIKARRVYNKALKKYWNELIIRENCHPAKSTIVVWIQLPLWICMSIAIRNLTLMLPPSNDALIRFTELTEGGILWFTNLTDIDPTMCLPLILCLSNLLIIQIQTHARNKELTRKQAIVTNIFRSITLFMLPISYFLPSGVSLYWTTSSIYGLSQNVILLSPQLRKWLGIPRTPYNHENPYKYIIDKTKSSIKIAK